MADLFSDGFEDGTTDAWDVVWDPDTDMSVVVGAALHGNYGLNLLMDNDTAMFIRDETPSAETRYRFRFYIDPNGLTMDADEYINIAAPQNAAGGSMFPVSLKYSGGYNIVVTDSADGGWDFTSGNLLITDEPHCVEIDWKAATGVGNDDGYFTVWIDDVQRSNITSIDSDTEEVSKIEFGMSYTPSTITGTYFLDDFASNDDGSKIGLVGENAVLFGTNF